MVLTFNLLSPFSRRLFLAAVFAAAAGNPLAAQTPMPPTIRRPAEVAAWDSTARAQPAAADGFRVQLYLGDLQAARQLRADLRRQQPLPVYVMDLAPNYRVCLGDFRDRFAAEHLRAQWLAAYPTATVIPCSIAPPVLPAAQENRD